jgi:hypothetical protein
LRDLGIEVGGLDFGALEKFAGQNTKVKHNGVRQYLPITFRLLSAAALDIEAFSAYALKLSSIDRPLAPTPAARAIDLISFLTCWIDCSRRSHWLLRETLMHEGALLRLRTTTPCSASDAGTVATVRSPSHGVPMIRGDVVLYEMHCDPQKLVIALRGGVPPIESLPTENIKLCYWRSCSDPNIKSLRLDDFSFHLLSCIDGERSIALICKCLLGRARPSLKFLGVLDKLANVGVLGFKLSATGTGR